MKRIPMLLLMIAPYAVLVVCYLMDLDIVFGLSIYGALLLFNMIYAFLLPGLGYNGKQLLFWNLLLKLWNIPLVLVILLVTLISSLAGGEGIRDEAVLLLFMALLSCYLIQLSSAMFGISGLRWCHKHGALSKAGRTAGSIAQFVPFVDVIASILCYIMLRKVAQPRH